jgi:hypothetical protein
MTRLNSILRRVVPCTSLAIVAAMVTAVPMKTAAADVNWQSNSQWRHSDYKDGDQDWRYGGYRSDGERSFGGQPYYFDQQNYYTPQPAYYHQPAAASEQPGSNLQVITP